jgi:hypothetical protein
VGESRKISIFAVKCQDAPSRVFGITHAIKESLAGVIRRNNQNRVAMPSCSQSVQRDREMRARLVGRCPSDPRWSEIWPARRASLVGKVGDKVPWLEFRSAYDK